MKTISHKNYRDISLNENNTVLFEIECYKIISNVKTLVPTFFNLSYRNITVDKSYFVVLISSR